SGVGMIPLLRKVISAISPAEIWLNINAKMLTIISIGTTWISRLKIKRLKFILMIYYNDKVGV
ncbi:TPA: hypothetical protein ACKRMM_006127, partial [Pseudomonas aeruginosa]